MRYRAARWRGSDGLPGSGGSALTAQTYRARDGAQLMYREWTGSAPLTVVLLHGSGTDGRYLAPLAHRLLKLSQASIVVPDLRAHGESNLGRPGDVSYLGQLEHDLEDLHQHIKAQRPADRLVLGGHSSGGGMAMHTPPPICFRLMHCC